MTKDKNSQKLIQDVQNTGDEAARLLADLENGSTPSQVNYRPNTANDNTSRSSQRQTDSPTFSGAQIALPVTILGLFALIITFIAVADQTQQPSLNSSDSSSSVVNDPVQKQKPMMTSYQRNFYNNTLANANQAILKSEHKASIVNLQTLKNDQYKNLIGVNSGLVDNKIINAKKQIKFLDQPGDSEYWEGEHFGYQWFDDHDDNDFKVFVAYSKTCRNPMVTFAYRPNSSDRKSKPIKTVSMKPKKYISTMYVPYYQNYALWVEDFNCN